MINPNRAYAVSRAQLLLTHGVNERMVGRCRFEHCQGLPWHRAVYRRKAFLAAVDENGLFEAESFIQEKLLSRNPWAGLFAAPKPASNM